MQTTEYELRDRIDQLATYRGEGTELITVAVPPDKSLRTVREHINREYTQAENIKADQTRTHVQDALGRIRRLLQAYEATPPNGLVIYAGVVDGELQDAVFDDLDTPVDVSLYRCAAEFEAAPVEQVLTPSEVYGLLVLERGSAALGRLVGERIVSTRTLESQVMGKSRAGGQSAQRFERERDRQKHEFFAQVADAAEQTFLDEPTVDGLLLGGTTITVDEFQQGDYLHHELRDRILGVYPIEYATAQGLSQLVERTEDVLSDAERRREREALDRFFTALGQDGEVAYGAAETRTALDYGAVDVLLVSDARPSAEIRELETATTDHGGECLVVSTAQTEGRSLILRSEVLEHSSGFQSTKLRRSGLVAGSRLDQPHRVAGIGADDVRQSVDRDRVRVALRPNCVLDALSGWLIVSERRQRPSLRGL